MRSRTLLILLALLLAVCAGAAEAPGTEEAADADYVVIIEAGKLTAEGTPLELKNRYAADYLTVYGVDESAAEALGYPVERVRDGLRLSLPSTAAATKLILENPALFVDYEIVKGRMDDVFLRVTGKIPEIGGEEK